MAAANGTILPDSYFDGLSSLWGGCAYVGAAIVATGLVLQTVRSKPDPANYVVVVAKVLMIAVATLFIRQWLMRINDVVVAFSSVFGIDPTAVDEKFVRFVSGNTDGTDTSIWDVIWDTKSIGTAVCYALLWFFGWLAWGVQYIVKLIGHILLTVGWSLTPIFLGFFMLRVMSGVAVKYLLGLVAITCWPFGWVITAVVTNALLDAAATQSLIPVIVPGGLVAPMVTVLLIGVWMLVTSALAPYVTYKVLTTGANPAAAFAQGIAGVAQATLAGGVGAATAAVTGGASVPATVAAAAVGAMAAGTESSARGGGSARTTSTVVGGAAGLYGGRFIRQQTAAMKEMASAESRRAAASERFEAHFADSRRQNEQRRSSFPHQPHHPDPNRAAIEIEARHVQE